MLMLSPCRPGKKRALLALVFLLLRAFALSYSLRRFTPPHPHTAHGSPYLALVSQLSMEIWPSVASPQRLSVARTLNYTPSLFASSLQTESPVFCVLPCSSSFPQAPFFCNGCKDVLHAPLRGTAPPSRFSLLAMLAGTATGGSTPDD